MTFPGPTEHDLFGRLMSQLARRSQRKLLGQEWTHAWLAEQLASHCLDRLPAGESPQVVDMCCGSGSIIAAVLREARHRNAGMTLDGLTRAATGFDVDPLAVMLAKTTWVVTLSQYLQGAGPGRRDPDLSRGFTLRDDSRNPQDSTTRRGR